MKGLIVWRFHANEILVHRGGSRTAATTKMELFEIIVNGFQPLTIITKCSNLDVAAVLDPPQVHLKQLKLSPEFLSGVFPGWNGSI